MKFKYKFKKFLLFFFALYLPVFFYANKEKEVKGEVVVGTAALLVMLAAAAYGVTLYSTSPEKLEELATDLMDEYELARSKFQVLPGGAGGGDDDKPPSWRELLEKVRTSGGKFAFSTGAMACMSGWANKLYNKMGINKKISFANEKINGFVNSLFGTEVKDVPVTSFKRLVNSSGQSFFPNFSADFYVGLYGGCDIRIRDCLEDFRNDILYRDYVLVYTALNYSPSSYDYRSAKYYFIHKNDLSNVDTIDIYEGFDRFGYMRIFSCPNTSFTSIRQIYSDTGNFKNGMYAGTHYTDTSKEQPFGYRTTDVISVYLNPSLISKIRFLPSAPSPTSSPIQHNVKSDFDTYAVNDLLDKFLDTYKVPDIQQPLNVPSQKIINNINNNYYNPDGSIKAELQDIKNVLQDLTHNINPNINNHYEYVTNVFNEPSPSPNPSPEPSPNPNPEPSPNPIPNLEPIPDDFKFSNLKEPNKFLLPAWIVDRFPFCLPFDLFKILKKLDTVPKAPRFSFVFLTSTIDIDLSKFDVVALIFRRLLTILFVVSLIYASKIMIKN